MQLDQTHIVIRERRPSELLDLALRVTQRHLGPLLVATGVLALPLAGLNGWLLSWIVADEYSGATVSHHLWTMTWLVFLEAPLATVLMTVYLGRTMFLQPASFRDLLGAVVPFLPRLAYVHLLIRGVLPGLVLVMWNDRDLQEESAVFLLLLLCAYVLLIRVLRPFLNEIILLERNPLRSQNASTITVARRSRLLHGPSSGDLLGHAMATAVALAVLFFSLAGTLWFLQGIIWNRWAWGPFLVHFGMPTVLWLLAVYAGVLRFLTYLDLRIKREGWEVELKVRAAAVELMEHPA